MSRRSPPGGRYECFRWTLLRTGETPVLRLDGVGPDVSPAPVGQDGFVYYNSSCYLQVWASRSPQTPLKKEGFEYVPPFCSAGGTLPAPARGGAHLTHW
ncbi:hypothetical protein [Kamptonema formosum]|uniref:hypothetical protein n=1 Tax=Kamptonema formosum TaxID=331992 RepID=UPI0012DF2992|nr:hypothetical protein [Oscillatoria sp. PCC 10802]